MASSDEVFVGSIDQGTTSSRFLIFDKKGEPVAVHQEEFSQIYPNPGWHEHDPEEIIKSVENCIEGALKIFEKDGHSKDSIKSIGITNQRETTVVWDVKTGEALYNAIVWTDTRTAALARELKHRSDSDKLQDICGLPISTYPSVTKLLWLLRNEEKVRKSYEAGNLAFGTIDAWLIYKLNGGPEKNVFVSDPTNASRTMFMDIHTLKYSDIVLDFFSYEYDMRKVHMPEIVRSSDTKSFGQISSGSLKGFPIMGCLGDQSAALVGQKGFEPGEAKNTYGTGCFLLYNVGKKPVISKHGLLATVAYDFDGTPVYALEGSIAVAGSGVKFLMHNLGFSHASHKITELAETVQDNGGLVFVTAFSGLFAPYWIDDAHGTMFGITHHTERGHIARATLEAVCFQTKAILDAMEKDSGHKLSELKVDGGMSNSELCMQTQADLVSIPIVRPKMRETTALGAAIAAGFAAEVWKSFHELKEVNTAGQTVFEPKMEAKASAKMFKRWERAVSMCKGWLAEDEEVAKEDAAELEEESKKEGEVAASEPEEAKEDAAKLNEESKANAAEPEEEAKEPAAEPKEEAKDTAAESKEESKVDAAEPQEESKVNAAEHKEEVKQDAVESKEEAKQVAPDLKEEPKEDATELKGEPKQDALELTEQPKEDAAASEEEPKQGALELTEQPKRDAPELEEESKVDATELKEPTKKEGEVAVSA